MIDIEQFAVVEGHDAVDHNGAGLVGARDESGRWLTPSELEEAKAKGRAYFLARFGSLSRRLYPKTPSIQSETDAAE
ncbi:MAG TPA: hypothetical protein VGL35_09450 [Rhizomicrobium sp.]|jgi:hypothetical protein